MTDQAEQRRRVTARARLHHLLYAQRVAIRKAERGDETALAEMPDLKREIARLRAELGQS